MPNITIFNQCDGEVSMEYNIFYIPEFGQFPGVQAYGPIPEGFTTTLTVSDVGDCKFSQWSDGSTARELTITMGSEDITLIAITSAKAINKVVLGTTVLMDLSEDTLTTSSQLATGVTAHGQDGKYITGSGKMVNQAQSVTQHDVKNGVSYTDSNGVMVQGNATALPSAQHYITNKADTITISDGVGSRHIDNGSAITVQLSAIDIANIISENIKDQVTILGTTGTYTGGGGQYEEYCANGSIGGNTCTSYHISDTATSIRDSAFKGCTNLTTISGGSNITSAAGSAFYGCSSLNNISFPRLSSLSNSSTFRGCSSLTNASFPAIMRLSGGTHFYGCGFTKIDHTIFPALTSLTAGTMFQVCTNLIEVDLPNVTFGTAYDGYTSCANIFQGCTSLVTADISGSAYVPNAMFLGCSALTNIIVKNGVQVRSGTSGQANATKFATINGITYMCYDSSPTNIVRASDPSTVIGQLSQSSRSFTADGVTFTYVNNGKFTVAW